MSLKSYTSALILLIALSSEYRLINPYECHQKKLFAKLYFLLANEVSFVWLLLVCILSVWAKRYPASSPRPRIRQWETKSGFSIQTLFSSSIVCICYWVFYLIILPASVKYQQDLTFLNFRTEILEIKITGVFIWKIQKSCPKHKISYTHILQTHTRWSNLASTDSFPTQGCSKDQN